MAKTRMIAEMNSQGGLASPEKGKVSTKAATPVNSAARTALVRR